MWDGDAVAKGRTQQEGRCDDGSRKRWRNGICSEREGRPIRAEENQPTRTFELWEATQDKRSACKGGAPRSMPRSSQCMSIPRAWRCSHAVDDSTVPINSPAPGAPPQPQPHQHVLRNWPPPSYSWPSQSEESGGSKQHLAEATFPDPAPKISWLPNTIAACTSS